MARLPWPLPVVAGAAVAAAMALLVGTLALRLRGPYFAIFTFGLAELAKHTLIWYETGVTGTVGRLLLSPPDAVTLYYTVLGVAALAVAIAVLAAARSRWGIALVGIGADEERAETLGIDTTRVKIAVFALSAAVMGAVGAAMAPRWTYLDPQVFNPLVSFQTVIMALLGGATTVIGPVLGAVFLGPPVRDAAAAVPLRLHAEPGAGADRGGAAAAVRPRGAASPPPDRGPARTSLPLAVSRYSRRSDALPGRKTECHAERVEMFDAPGAACGGHDGGSQRRAASSGHCSMIRIATVERAIAGPTARRCPNA